MGWWPRQLRQTHLGGSEDRQLIIIDLPSTRIVPLKSYILRLPEELLYYICSLCSITRTDSRPGVVRRGLGRRSLTAVMLTCQRFYRIAQCFLYRGLRLRLIPSTIRTILFYRSLMVSKTISRHCQSLTLEFPPWYIYKLTARDQIIAETILTSLPAVRKIHIEGLPEWAIPQLFSHIHNYMRELNHLRISDTSEDVLASIWQDLNPPQLRSMILNDVGESFYDEYQPISEVCIVDMAILFQFRQYVYS